mmetsp:Transcript_73527/g.237897  ORF Transcript_73527/g.237897 Transcript_73527/m.237897 type:complete len:248 (-) Transcript_73527:359-1102(-)
MFQHQAGRRWQHDQHPAERLAHSALSACTAWCWRVAQPHPRWRSRRCPGVGEDLGIPRGRAGIVPAAPAAQRFGRGHDGMSTCAVGPHGRPAWKPLRCCFVGHGAQPPVGGALDLCQARGRGGPWGKGRGTCLGLLGPLRVRDGACVSRRLRLGSSTCCVPLRAPEPRRHACRRICKGCCAFGASVERLPLGHGWHRRVGLAGVTGSCTAWCRSHSACIPSWHGHANRGSLVQAPLRNLASNTSCAC